MKLMTGLDLGPPRFPLKSLTQEEVKQMDKDIKALNIDHVYK